MTSEPSPITRDTIMALNGASSMAELLHVLLQMFNVEVDFLFDFYIIFVLLEVQRDDGVTGHSEWHQIDIITTTGRWSDATCGRFKRVFAAQGICIVFINFIPTLFLQVNRFDLATPHMKNKRPIRITKKLNVNASGTYGLCGILVTVFFRDCVDLFLFQTLAGVDEMDTNSYGFIGKSPVNNGEWIMYEKKIMTAMDSE